MSGNGGKTYTIEEAKSAVAKVKNAVVGAHCDIKEQYQGVPNLTFIKMDITIKVKGNEKNLDIT